jgi:serine/threonine protein kinase
MDGNGNIKIADFGFASLIRADFRFEEFCGSPEYASPEMIAR